MFADLVLLNGKIVTVDEKESIVEAVAVKFGKMLAVGANGEIKRLIGKETMVVDLRGKNCDTWTNRLPLSYDSDGGNNDGPNQS